MHVIPGPSRNYTESSNVRVVYNTPSSIVVNSSNYAIKKDNRFKIYVCGWFNENRGIESIISLLSLLDKDEYVIIAAGNLGKYYDEFVENEVVDYLGHLTSSDSFSVYKDIDVVLSFYNPSVEINRKAEPNKWYDCVLNNKPFITNTGIETVEPFLSAGLAYTVEYGDYQKIFETIESIKNRSGSNYSEKNMLDIKFWDVSFTDILEKDLGLKKK
ncbi:glycosyltransferase family protein [Vibrio cyclitrophicus]|uniref:hypothetical protein n=1 Tax=Vibrio cyclitrophicus TaxID=47951 RepID=UPI00389EAB04